LLFDATIFFSLFSPSRAHIHIHIQRKPPTESARFLRAAVKGKIKGPRVDGGAKTIRATGKLVVAGDGGGSAAGCSTSAAGDRFIVRHVPIRAL
jgi:hypothetical protein